MRKDLLVKLVIVPLIIFIGAVGIFLLYPYKPSSPPKVDDKGATEEGVYKVREANNKFAFSLYRELAPKGEFLSMEEKNIFFSPYSIFSAMAMTYEGAEGDTKKEIESVFNFPEKEILEPNFAKIYNKINGKEKEFVLRTGNALWIQKNFPILEEFKKRVERYYGGKAKNLDFVNETEKSREIINSFIEKQTEEKIKDLIPKGILDGSTRLVITNAIYFNGTWKVKFDKKNTRDMDFYIKEDRSVKVPMMYMKPEKEKFNYAETEDVQFLELPYKGDRISMYIILPKKGVSMLDIEKKINYDFIKSLKKKIKEVKIDGIYLPKFKIEEKYFLKDILIHMGMRDSFTLKADFSKIDGKRDLFIKDVIHQAYIDVNEKGTEAAGATAVIVEKMAAVPTKIIFKVDHPFIFFIQDKETGIILFMGRIVNPLG